MPKDSAHTMEQARWEFYSGLHARAKDRLARAFSGEVSTWYQHVGKYRDLETVLDCETRYPQLKKDF